MADDRQNRIRQRAHELWEGEGRPDGAHERHWQQAEREIDLGKQAANRKSAASATKPAAAKAAKPIAAKPIKSTAPAAAMKPANAAAKPGIGVKKG